MAVGQLQRYQLTHRHREQAPSHMLISVHIGSVVFEDQAPGSANCGLTKSNAAN